MQIVFDHNLHADLHVPGRGDDEEQEDDCDRRLPEDLRRAGLVAAEQHHHDHKHRNDQQRHRDRREALAPEIARAGMRGAEIADAAERRAHGRCAVGLAHRPPPIT
jgi:hypothetical protein